MKKLSFLLLLLLAMTVFTACNDDEKTVNKQSFSSTINNRAIDGNEVVFSQSTAKAEVNFTDMTILFTSEYRDADGQTHSLTTPAMSMITKGGSVYQFNGNIGSEALNGYFDMATGMLWYTFISGGNEVFSSSHLLYAYSTTTVTNPDNGNHYSHKESAYLFAPDARGETCIMRISNFTPNIAGAVEASEIQYEGLTLTPTTTGYTITANEVEPTNYSGRFIITDLNIALDSQCKVINGTFKCGDLDFTVNGDLFPIN